MPPVVNYGIIPYNNLLENWCHSSVNTLVVVTNIITSLIFHI